MEFIRRLILFSLASVVVYGLTSKFTKSSNTENVSSIEPPISRDLSTQRKLTSTEQSKLERQAEEKVTKVKRLQAATYKQWQNASCVLPTSSTEMDRSCEFVAGLTQSQGKEKMIEAMRETVAKRLMVEQNANEINDDLKAQAKAQIEERLTAILDAESPESVKTNCPKDGSACD